MITHNQSCLALKASHPKINQQSKITVQNQSTTHNQGYLAKLLYFTNLDVPEIKEISLTKPPFGVKTRVRSRANLTRRICAIIVRSQKDSIHIHMCMRVESNCNILWLTILHSLDISECPSAMESLLLESLLFECADDHLSMNHQHSSFAEKITSIMSSTHLVNTIGYRSFAQYLAL